MFLERRPESLLPSGTRVSVGRSFGRCRVDSRCRASRVRYQLQAPVVIAGRKGVPSAPPFRTG